ncbi:MAG: ExbD/TolR family protein [Candidatus Sulfotelmatobacter sp.]
MRWLKTSNLAKPKTRAWSVALLTLVTTLSAAPYSAAQAMQKGISVELASTSSAVPVPAADNPDALIVTVTYTGKLYIGIDPVTPGSLPQKLKSRGPDRAQNLYIKADARAHYACVVKVLDAARTAGVATVTLLTTQPQTPQAGATVPPEGIEMELVRRSPAAPR